MQMSCSSRHSGRSFKSVCVLAAPNHNHPPFFSSSCLFLCSLLTCGIAMACLWPRSGKQERLFKNLCFKNSHLISCSFFNLLVISHFEMEKIFQSNFYTLFQGNVSKFKSCVALKLNALKHVIDISNTLLTVSECNYSLIALISQ